MQKTIITTRAGSFAVVVRVKALQKSTSRDETKRAESVVVNRLQRSERWMKRRAEVRDARKEKKSKRGSKR